MVIIKTGGGGCMEADMDMFITGGFKARCEFIPTPPLLMSYLVSLC